MARGANFRKIPKRVFHLSDGTRSNDFLCGFNPDNNDTAIYKGNYIHGVVSDVDFLKTSPRSVCPECCMMFVQKLLDKDEV